MIDRRFLASLVAILVANEFASYAVSRSPAAGVTAFFALAGLFLLVALLSTEFALLVVLAELVVGGKGYLYHWPVTLHNGELAIDVSIRLAFFVIILIVWLFKRRYKKQSFFASVHPYTGYLIALAVVVTLGFVNSLLHGYPFKTVFFDVNAYLYFLLAPVIFVSLEQEEQRKRLFNLFFAGILVIGLKSLVILGLFTHFGLSSLEPIYHWIRESGVGEIAHIFGGFYRVFFQSQIFGLVGFLIAFGMLTVRLIRDSHDDRGGLYLISLAGVTAIFVSLSRSFWIGAAVSLLVGGLALIRLKLGGRTALRLIGLLASLAGLAFVLIRWALFFPLPFPVGQPSGDVALVRERFSRRQPAVESRQALLGPLVNHIRQHPVLGTGFGTPITYASSDPRIARAGRPAKFTTTAFEWGWLDIAVKMGLTGLLVYLIFLKRLIRDCLQRFTAASPEQVAVSFGLLLALVGLVVTHLFSPYLNHPLGIGIVLLSAALLRAMPAKSP